MPSPFGSPVAWPEDDLVAVSRTLDEDLALAGYASGTFPMPGYAGMTGWYSPLQRGVLPLDRLRVTRSLRQSMRRYRCTVDQDFEAVLAGCADRRRPGGWIDRDIRRVYTGLHRRGVAHSVETWTLDGRLAGGLYGVGLGGLFAGESMFHRDDLGRDASKVALVALVERLRAAGERGRLLDVQWQTPHLATMGVIVIPRAEYLDRLAVALTRPDPDWSTPAPPPALGG